MRWRLYDYHNAKNYDNHHIIKYFDLADNNLINQVQYIKTLDDLDNINVNEQIETDNNFRGVIKQTINIYPEVGSNSLLQNGWD